MTDSVTGAGDGTRAVRAGLPEPVKHEPTLPGPVFAAHFHLPGDPTGPYTYGRDENPTWTHLERAIGELEAPGQGRRRDARLRLRHGGHLGRSSSHSWAPATRSCCPSDGYQVLPLVRAQLEAYGVEVRTAPTGGDAQLDVLDGAKLLWIETPSNPGLDVCDVRRLVEAAHARGCLVAVDNTLATPLGQRPLELGADFSVASGTKQLTGHGDILLGYVTGGDAAAMASVRRWRKIVGAIPGPMEAWLAHRSLATLQLRVDRQNANALVIAEALRDRPEELGVRYPGLPGDPSHKIACSADAALRVRGVVHAAHARACRPFSRRAAIGGRRDQLRRGAVDGRAAWPLGRRRGAGGLHPLLGRCRGSAGPRGGCAARAGRVRLSERPLSDRSVAGHVRRTVRASPLVARTVPVLRAKNRANKAS